MRKDCDGQPSTWTARPPFSSLRARLLLLLFLALLPAYGLLLYSAFQVREQAADNARENALWLTRLMAMEQKNLIGAIHQQLLNLAQLSVVRRPDAGVACSRAFADLRKRNTLYANLGVIGADGLLRCSALPLTQRINLADRGYFREAMRTRAFAIGDYQIGQVTGKGVANLAYPVLNAVGDPEAVVFISLDLAALTDKVIETAVLPEGSTVMIADNRGIILARRPDPEKWVGLSLPDAPLFKTIRARSDEGSAQETGLDGIERLYVFAPFHVNSIRRVYVVVGIPTAVVFSEVGRDFRRIFLLMVLVTAVVSIAAWFGCRILILQPVDTLIQAAQRLGQGDLSARTDMPRSTEEFGQLAQSFDAMAFALQTRHAEAARAEAQFTNIVNLAADAIISVGADQRILTFNHGAERIFGYTAAEVAGQPLDMLLPTRFAAAHRAHIRHFAAEPDAARAMDRRSEIHGQRRDGSEFPAEASISKVKENDSIRFTVFLRDISARKQAEQVLQQKDKLLTMVGSMAKVGGWEFDTRTLKGTWTHEVARIHDMDPEQETSVEIGLRFYQGESREIIEAAVKDAMEHGKSYDLELEIMTAKGTRKWVRTIGQPVREDGAIVKVWGSFQDITEHKRAAEEILQLNVNLERRVSERTAELQAANQELEAFSYSVSHDLRAPLRSIDGFSQAILDEYAHKLDDQGRDHLKRVRVATQHMGQLIDDMIKLARVARAEMQREAVDLSVLAADVLAALQKSEPDRRVEYLIEPGLVVEGDTSLLRVVLDNLLGNAWKFTGKQAHARIEFGAHSQETGGPAYFVRDNGAGFDMNYVGKLFGVFQRLHILSDFPGTGVGLATVQRIVQRHGGRVWAEGAVGKGATFYFVV